MTHGFNTNFDIPFAIINEWETLLKKQGVCSSFYAAAAWGYEQCMRDCEAAMGDLVPPPYDPDEDDDND